MTETITIVDKSAKADSADDVKARQNDQLKTYRDAVTQKAADLKKFAGDTVGGVKVDVQGEADADALSAAVTEFGPDTISIPVGGSVSWKVNGFHTISFNAGEDA
jgi:plastocyanin